MLGAMRVVAGDSQPDVWVTHPVATAADWGLAGCAVGAAAGLEALFVGSLVGAAAGGVVFTAGGAASAMPAGQRAHVEATLRECLRAPGGSEALARKVAEAVQFRLGGREQAAGGPRPLLVVTVEEVSLQSISVWRTDLVDAYLLELRAAVRLRSAPGGPVLYERQVVARGTPLNTDEWGRRNTEAVQQSVDQLLRAAAEQIADEMLWLYPLPGQADGGEGGGTAHGGGFGLRVVEAPWRWRTPLIPSVDSLKPTLSWEVFPREQDRALTPQMAARVANVVYDLRLAPIARYGGELPPAGIFGRNRRRTALGWPSEAVYARDGFPDPRHSVEEILLPDMLYFWTVRARFTLDGQPRATEWASPGASGRRTAPPLSWHSYRFVTPKQ
ncbi:MAG: hypothetical protein HZB55_15065 [Deltaproteobacteria bacterium]|nr:hypothetical protein [Deltaproteobacteria bacterium]